jgi:ribosomal-protein-alanine N-acetyltransferase
MGAGLSERERGGTDVEDQEERVEAVITIRRACASDVDPIARIEAGSYANPWRPETFRSLLHRDGARVLVADAPDAGVVGYAVFWWVKDQAELANIAVVKDARGRGIGGALLDRALEEAGALGVASVFLEVRVSNQAAHRLYQSRGFTRISTRTGYYQNPREDAWVLVKTLGAAESAVVSVEGGEGPALPDRADG